MAALFQALALVGGVARAADAESAAVVFAYSRIGEDESPSSSLRIEQFEAHLEELSDEDYTVLPLTDIVAAIRSGKPLPDRAIALTFDDASRSFYQNAWPRLKEAGLPFTLFVATDAIDRESPGHMTWAELRQVAATPGATLGALGASTSSQLSRPLADVRADLDRMDGRFVAMLGQKPTLFAYPQGEYTAALRGLIGERGYAAAFGMQSGVVYTGADRLALPRFIMTESYGSIERFRIAADALPLPVSDVTPEDTLVTVNPPPIGFTVDTAVGDLSRLACFVSGLGRAALERIAEDRVEVRMTTPFPPGRSRINCTLPANEGRWRWFGLQLVVPE